jgi:hypothetical protein
MYPTEYPANVRMVDLTAHPAALIRSGKVR